MKRAELCDCDSTRSVGSRYGKLRFLLSASVTISVRIWAVTVNRGKLPELTRADFQRCAKPSAILVIGSVVVAELITAFSDS